ncbi:tyrosine-type recombinase/integrase [Tunturibacter psychrotolerans]|uniref:Tyrosine-type recombinase/integrase n=1 Tax=Tunturiibacter psychrotolerans TaxID=3069686 RepID=A0AAU7ZKX9_9BACT
MANGTVKKPKAIKGIFERPDGSGIWWINYYIEGKRFREKVGRRSDAVTLYQRRKTDARMGVKMPEVRARRAVLFEEIAADALVYSQEHKASYPGDRSTVGKLLPTFGKIPLDNITPQTIKAYLDKRTDLTKTTINRYRGTISMIFEEAIRNEKATANPARLVRLHREDNSRVRFVTFAEEATIRAIIRERCPTHEPEMTLALETGMRRGEQYSLEWDRVDVERRQLLLLKTKNGTARVVILTTVAVAALEELRERRNQLKIKKEMERALVLTTGSSMALEDQQSQTVCLTRYGEPMASPRAWFELVMEEAIKRNSALKDVTWHIFRHTYISRLVMAGVDLRTVQELAGHKDIKMTVRYAHLAPAHKLAAVDRLAEYRQEQEKAEAQRAVELALVAA